MTPHSAANDQPAHDHPADGPRAPVKVASPDAVLAVVPHLIGFHPSRSLVVLGIGGPSDQVTMAFRYDLPDPPDADLAADIAEHAREVLDRSEVPAAIVIGYGPAPLVSPVVDEVVGALVHDGLAIREVLRADGGRYWSALCHDPACCPPDGVPYDPCSHPVSDALNRAGLDALADREALARTLQPEPGTARAIRQATERALRRLGKLAARAQRAGEDPSAAVADAGRRAVQRAIADYRTGATISRPGLAFIAVCAADVRVRDDAWARMDPEHRDEHVRLWTDVVTGAAPEFVPAPASLLAFTAWQCGEGALANLAAERALAASPDYSMALLIAAAVQGGLPPSAARLPMTPEDVAASFAGESGPGREDSSPSPRGRSGSGR